MAIHRAAWLERRYGAEIDWQPFDLHPEYPPEGMPRSEQEGGFPEGFVDHYRSMIEAAGFPYHPPGVTPNSLLSLQLVELARHRGCFAELHVLLFYSYWSLGRDIGDPEGLAEIGASVGLDKNEIRETLADGRYRERIESSTQYARELGVDGVPAWLMDDRLLVIGAHPLEVFEQAMGRLGHEPVNGD
ncbi:MAG: DsbA family oxidoreductase [Acidimicrobiales bacterium]